MKQNKITKAVFILGGLALMVGGVVAADAANGRNISNQSFEGGNAIHREDGMMRGGILGLNEEDRGQRVADRELMRAERGSHREAVTEAISEHNFEKWQAAIGENHPFAETITAENFPAFVEIHESMDGEPREEIRAKLAELGIEQKANGFGLGHGMGNSGCQRINE